MISYIVKYDKKFTTNPNYTLVSSKESSNFNKVY